MPSSWVKSWLRTGVAPKFQVGQTVWMVLGQDAPQRSVVEDLMFDDSSRDAKRNYVGNWQYDLGHQGKWYYEHSVFETAKLAQQYLDGINKF